MNNRQFRRLISDKERNGNGPTLDGAGAALSSLGAKKSSFMPMTPRTVVKGGADVDFARQMRERNAALRPTKKFKSSAPKGVKYASEYTDRAKARAEAEDGGDEDDKASRIKALEEQMKLGQIPEEMFEALRDNITGGDISSTHLVKGLDRKLLERVRRGENVLGGGGDRTSAEPPADVDDELDRLEEMEVKATERQKAEKKGTMAPPAPLAGIKRSRNDIMAELKAQRKAAAEARAAPAFDSRWSKVGEKEKSRIEVDHKGREVMITVDEDGNIKKKVRKVPMQDKDSEKLASDIPDDSKPILGSDAVMPEAHAAPASEDDDDDIFEGVGVAYNPLGDDDDSDDSSDDEEGDKLKHEPVAQKDRIKTAAIDEGQSDKISKAESPAKPRNYFNDITSTADDSPHDRLSGVQDLLRKAAKMDPKASDEAADEDDRQEDREERLKKRAQMLAQQDRDLDDMDMGFGGGRYEDGEEDEGKVKLSQWKDSDAAGGEDDKKGAGGAGKKKRKPKKRKGDANNADDIMRVIEGRKAAGEK